ncbi:MAG: DUF4349 domain-containing protein [Armatimonadia bacterium]|nr:DUF4349 domain-containing protein [Armatimonadia bacterium]
MTSDGLTPEQIALLEDYLDGRCDAEGETEAEELVRTTPAAGDWLDQAAADICAYRDVMTRRVESVSVAERVMERVRIRPRLKREGGSSPWLTIGLSAAVCGVLVVILFPVFGKDRHKARQTSCLSNLRMVAQVVLSYEERTGSLPHHQRWPDQIRPYHRNDQLLHCPSDAGSEGISYAMNPALSERSLGRVANPAEAILLYEVDGRGQPAFRHGDGMHVAFADGHVKWVDELPAGLARSSGVPGASADAEAEIAYDATMEVWVEDLGEALPAAEAAAMQRDGLILVSRLDRTTRPPLGELVCRVPADQRTEAMAEFSQLGWLANRRLEGEDVTLQTRQAERRLERIRQEAGGSESSAAPSPAGPDVASEDRAVDTLSELASRTQMTTISLRLPEGDPTDEGSLASSLASAAAASKTGLVAGLTVAVWLLSFIWLWGPPLGVWIWHRRRRLLDVPADFGRGEG